MVEGGRDETEERLCMSGRYPLLHIACTLRLYSKRVIPVTIHYTHIQAYNPSHFHSKFSLSMS